MTILLLALGLLPLAGLGSFVLGSGRAADRIGAWGGAAVCAVALAPVVQALRDGASAAFYAPWHVPGGSFHVAIDPLSAVFLVPILVLGGLGAIYGREYMDREGQGAPRAHWLFYNLLVAALILVVIARNGILFLVAWEVMALASFFLVTTDDDREDVREAGRTYLIATHLGTAFLFGLFALLGHHAGSLDFDGFETLSGRVPGGATVAFLLALVGFGTKAGFVPFHVWLPEAHPAAPSHVSALMSGAMIKTGIYGILRTLTFLGPPPVEWGGILVAVGLITGVGGVVFALAQPDLKRLLAYSSVENMGIVALALGVGLLGLSSGNPAVAALGFAGALLHVVNHAVYKGLLFLGAGTVLHAAGTGRLDRLGGLLKRMPRTGRAFLVGSIAIAGLPPLNGFIGEFLIFLGGFQGTSSDRAAVAVPLVGALIGLALIGGLAAACFTRVLGIVFLGQPRGEESLSAHDPGPAMGGAQAILAVACIALGLLAPAAVRTVLPAVAVLADPSALEAEAMTGLTALTGIFAALFVLVGLLALLRVRLLAGRTVSESGTWDCGYAAPTARMQYTASSFAQPLTDMFRFALRPRRRQDLPRGLFPEPGAFATDTPDFCREVVYVPLFRGTARALLGLRRLQHGNLHIYVLYIAVTLLVLLIWKLG